MALSLAGKTAIITGAGSGINLAFARALLGRKCNVLFADLALRPEAQELVSNHSSPSWGGRGRAVFQRTDVREWRHLERMFDVARQELGGIDVVCPGAGVYEPSFSNFHHPPGTPPSNDAPNSNRFASLDINLAHPIRTTQLALQHFLAKPTPPHSQSTHAHSRPPKAIIHISSIAGQATPFTSPIYTAAKHGINGFVRSLAPLSRDPRVNVRVTAVAPGLIKTPLWTDNAEKMRLVTESDVWVTPEAVVDVMMQLVERDVVELMDGSGPSDAVKFSQETKKKSVAVVGGMILEVAKAKVRVVEQFMDPGPSGEGSKLGNIKMLEEEVLDAYAKGTMSTAL